MSRLIFQGIALVVLILLGVTGYSEYFSYHAYYEKIIGNSQNLLLVFWGVVGAMIPTLWLAFSKKIKPRGLFVSMLIGIIFYGVCLVSMRGGLYGLGLILLSWNVFVLFGLGIIQSVVFLTLGNLCKQYILPDNERSWQRVGVSLVLGIAIQVLIIYVFVLLNILFPIVSRGLFAGGIFLVWKNRNTLYDAWQLVPQTIRTTKELLRSQSLTNKILGGVFILIVVVGFWYIINGFQLSFMPYTTAWDANHAYMFYPKMWSFNNGIYWFETSMNVDPDLWYVFLTYRFSLFRWTDGIGALSSDTIVLSINFWSGIYVLGLGAILTQTVAQYFTKKNIVIAVGILLFLLRLTSGMGAFLVFVDNKTDLGVLTLIIGAIISGFVVLRDLDDGIFEAITPLQKRTLMLSGFLYGIAALAKPTAMFDVINFVMYIWGVLIGPLGIIMVLLLIAGALTILEFRGIKDYIPQIRGKRIVGTGIVSGVGSLITTNKKRIIYGLSVVLIWGGAFVATKLLIKAPHLIGSIILQEQSYGGVELFKKIFLSKRLDSSSLLTQVGTDSLTSQCSLQSQGLSSSQELYADLKRSQGNAYNEDNVRYVGFGRKGNPSDLRREVTPFKGVWRGGVIPDGCSVVSLNNRDDLQILCENHQSIRGFDTAKIVELATQLNPSTYHGGLLQDITQEIQSGDSLEAVRSRVNPQLQELLVFIESWTLYKNPATQEIFLPYKWIIPFNVSYNWSLQNLSSYYTDIGIIRLICLIFSVIGVIYGIVQRNKIVIVSSLVTVAAWVLRGFIASGIVWYSLGIIIWSIISFLGLVGSLFEDDDSQQPVQQIIQVTFFAILGGIFVVQLFINMARIASQGGNGAFMRYKSSVGKQQVLDSSLQPSIKTVTGFDKQDVFDMQFPHYEPFINAMNARDEDEGGFIAGTYIRYFVEDQSHIKYDAFLTWLRRQFSDNNVCNSYLRLEDSKIRYMAIDLNIGTVVQGEGNRSLFDRFFARVNTATNSIEEEGVISMLIALNQQGYVNYLSSNNIGAKYAFTMSDDLFNGLEAEQLRLFKARMAVARYFRNDTQLLDTILQIAQQRIQDATFVTDIADILGIEIREQLLIELIRSNQITQQQIEPLTSYERTALSQYLSFASLQQSNPEQLIRQLTQTVQNSINNPNQILSIEVAK